MTTDAPRESVRPALVVTGAVLLLLVALVGALFVGRWMQLRPVGADTLDADRLAAVGIDVRAADEVGPAPSTACVEGGATASAILDHGSDAIGFVTPRDAVISTAIRGLGTLGAGTFVPTEVRDDAVTYVFVRDGEARLSYHLVPGPNGGWLLSSSTGCSG